ncbi:polycomb protein Pcl [Rhagoletis pomonella]|uniref:polycomb protein Pcl n=1 Tax=Rhagoletis pomonella TaxID=28610 RepID=UPI0017862CCD|nr:polycomb protein Pcl [Rhagoletis pomonella]XP_036333178.1 polycomb protein Pcl [Rhagoletis pomonella]XP_036333179.1 polycomb protein Pcl [Rhagoletis pomonella]XP_036333180.1 polycomb protein Pcl [Rhagoletis pomonella]
MEEFKMMNNSAYDTNVVHQNQTAIPHQAHPGHTPHHTNMPPAISGFFHPHASTLPIAAHQHAQLQHPAVSTGGSNDRQVAANSTAAAASHATGLFDQGQMQLTNTMEKSFFNGMQTSDTSFFSGVPPNVTTSAANSVHQITSQQPHQQQSNTILITNNFSAHQYGSTNSQLPDVSSQMLPRTIGDIVSGVTTAGAAAPGSYNNANAANIRIITTLPSTLHQPQKQQNQPMYNIGKEVEASVHEDIIQLPQFYHTPHQQPSAYAPHLSTLLPSHFTQQHYAATGTAPASLQLQQDDLQQQHPFFVPLTNNGGGVSPTAAVLTATPKLMTTLTSEDKPGIDAVTTSPAMITSPGTTTSTNSTLVLDRINICINNHYSDSLPLNNGLSNTLDCIGTTTTAATTPVAHTFSMATHAPQQPSPIIPAIHHKVLLDSASSGGAGGVLNTDSYTSQDSTLVIDEPDSTTTTPHTPPTTPENNSPPSPPTNLASTRSAIVPQSILAQNIIGETVVAGKENYSAAQTTVCVSSFKASINKAQHKMSTCTSGQSITTILIDDESDYIKSGLEKDADSGRGGTAGNTLNESVMEIEDNEVDDLSTQDTVSMMNNTKSGDITDLRPIHQELGIAKLDESKGETVMQESQLDSPPSPTPGKPVEIISNETSLSVTILTPPTPTSSSATSDDELKSISSKEISFAMGEDVFIRKEDSRQYLGTVIGSSAGGGLNKPQYIQYLIRFDDNSELWCGIEDMRRFGGSGGSGNAQMCVACKRPQVQDVVETCEDCRRGYHRGCTRETKPGSGVWWCLRCSKPMKNPIHEAHKAASKPLLQHNRSYKNTGDISKTLASQKLKTPADVYEFHIEDSETFTSDDEIPIKHIMEKARKSRDPTQNSNAISIRPKSIKKRNNFDDMLCEEIVSLDDENANDANSVSKMPVSSLMDKVKEKGLQNGMSSKPSKCATSLNQGKERIDTGGIIHDSVLVPQTVDHKSTSSVFIKESSVTTERSSRKRKAFTLSNSYKEVAAEAASKRYDSSRICDSSSDENSSSSRGTSLDVIIPPPKNFLGLNNPFRMVTPKKNSSASHAGGGVKSLLSFNCNGTMIKSSIFNTTALDFSSKLAALKSAGMFPNLSTSNLAKAAGQPRTVRTIKRRLSAKDITIGPNQEVRRRRTRRLSSNVEVISTTTINPIPSNFFPIHAKDLLSTHTHLITSGSKNMSLQSKQQKAAASVFVSSTSSSASASASSSPPGSVTSSVESQVEVLPPCKPSHGRRLRQRPQKNSPVNSRRSSISSASTASSTNSSSNITLAALQQQQQAIRTSGNTNTGSANATSMQDLKQSVKEYFGGVMNRIESGEQFCIRAKRQLASGQMQYLIEWGDVTGALQQPQTTPTSSTTAASSASATETGEVDQ